MKRKRKLPSNIGEDVASDGSLSYNYRFRAGKDAKGKPLQVVRRGFKTPSKALDALQKDRTERLGNRGAADPHTFSEVFDRWIEEHCQEHCEATTTEGYMAKGAYAKMCFGAVPLGELTPLQIESALNRLRKSGGKNGRPLAPKTVREIAAVVNACCNTAIRWGILDLNPMRRVTLPRMPAKEAKVLDSAQLEAVYSTDCEWLRPLLRLDASTGCRRGELLALTWADVDLGTGRLTVHRSLAQTPLKGVFLKSTKGRKGRQFTLPTSAIKALRAHRESQQKIREMFGPDYRNDLNLIFASPDGNFLKPDSVSAKVSLAFRKMGLPKGVSLHTLRHTHGSHLLSSGVPLPAVSKRLGHANSHVTATIYSHALDKDDQVAADAWDSIESRLSGSSAVASERNSAPLDTKANDATVVKSTS
jgi:integrase